MGKHSMKFIRTQLGARVSLFMAHKDDYSGLGVYLHLNMGRQHQDNRHSEVFLSEENIVELIQDLSESLEELRILKAQVEG